MRNIIPINISITSSKDCIYVTTLKRYRVASPCRQQYCYCVESNYQVNSVVNDSVESLFTRISVVASTDT